LLSVYTAIIQKWHGDELSDEERAEVSDMTGLFIESFTDSYAGVLNNNHHATIEVAQLLSWAMQAEAGSVLAGIYLDFITGMRTIYRQYGIEDVLDTPWIGKKWDQIYPSLASFEAVENESRSFRLEIESLIGNTVAKLREKLAS
jgi:hypothetical protein